MHAGIKGEVYLGSCPLGRELKEALKDFLTDQDYIVVDLGGFEIEETADCRVLAREVGEKVVEGIIFNQESYKREGLKVFGILIDEDMETLLAELVELGDIRAKSLMSEDLSNFNLLTLAGNEEFELVKEKLMAVI